MRPITATAKIIPPKNDPPLNPENTHKFIIIHYAIWVRRD